MQEETLALMAALELLSTHDPDEQYLHQRPAGWTMGQQVLQEWDAFCVELQRCDQFMAQRNEDRCSPCSPVPSCLAQVSGKPWILAAANFQNRWSKPP